MVVVVDVAVVVAAAMVVVTIVVAVVVVGALMQRVAMSAKNIFFLQNKCQEYVCDTCSVFAFRATIPGILGALKLFAFLWKNAICTQDANFVSWLPIQHFTCFQ